MKAARRMLPILVVLSAAPLAPAQLFNSGSDGSDGALSVTTGTTTLSMPDDGIFNVTTVNVASGATLTFTPNARNTPVYVLATGDITIAGTVHVDGKSGTSSPPVGGQGGPGGFAGGMPAFGPNIPPGDGQGPGAGLGGTTTGTGAAGVGAYSATGTDANDGDPYGSPLVVPLVGGSGGGGTVGQPGTGGGGGGGAILLASNTRVHVTGTVRSWGGSGWSSATGAGSGGAIRMVSPMVSGSGVVDVRGASGQPNFGRIRIDAIDRSQLQYNFQPTSQTSVGAFMVIFPNDLPTLDIIAAAGQAIPEGSGPTQVFLPFGSDPNQTVKVQARDFTGLVPISVALTPESGPRIIYDTEIDMAGGDVAQVVVDVTLPVNTLTHIHAWTR